MQKSLTEMLNEAAAAAHEAFIRELGNLIVITTSSKNPIIYVVPEIAELRRGLIAKTAVRTDIVAILPPSYSLSFTNNRLQP